MKKVFVGRCPNTEYGVVAVHPKYKEAVILAMQAMTFIDLVTSYTGQTKMHIEFSPLVEDSDIEELRATLERIVAEGDE